MSQERCRDAIFAAPPFGHLLCPPPPGPPPRGQPADACASLPPCRSHGHCAVALTVCYVLTCDGQVASGKLPVANQPLRAARVGAGTNWLSANELLRLRPMATIRQQEWLLIVIQKRDAAVASPDLPGAALPRCAHRSSVSCCLAAPSPSLATLPVPGAMQLAGGRVYA